MFQILTLSRRFVWRIRIRCTALVYAKRGLSDVFSEWSFLSFFIRRPSTATPPTSGEADEHDDYPNNFSVVLHCVLQFGEFSKEMSLVTIKIIEVGSPECRSAILFYTVQSKYPSKLLSISFQMINSDVMISLLRMQLHRSLHFISRSWIEVFCTLP